MAAPRWIWKTESALSAALSLAVVHSLVGNDFGYSIANTRPFAETAPDGKPLAFVPISGPVKPMRMGVLSTAGGKSSLTVRSFVDLCRKLLDQELLAQITVRAKP